jgi:hypothetical protein
MNRAPSQSKAQDTTASEDLARVDDAFGIGADTREIGVLPMSEATPLNGIPATLTHGEGAIARCSYCGRYSLDKKTLSDRQPVCDCGKSHGWSGSFEKPRSDAKWAGAAPRATQPMTNTAPVVVGDALTDKQRSAATLALNSAKRFIANGVEFGYIRMPDEDCPDPAKLTPKLIDDALAVLASQAAPASDAKQSSECASLEGLRERLLAPRDIVRDKEGWLSHPDFPDLDEDVNAQEFLEAFHIEAAFVSMESDDPTGAARYFAAGEPDCSYWTPTAPDGDGWMLLDIYDTEDGPYALFGRDAYEVEKAAKREHTRAMHDRIVNRTGVDAAPTPDILTTARTYTTTPGESVMGIALRQCGNEDEWRHILACNPRFADLLPHDYFPVGTVLILPPADAAKEAQS